MTGPVTFVNVLDIDPDTRDQVIAHLREGAATVFSRCAGFVSLELLLSTDGTRIINVARWDSAEHLSAAQSAPGAAAYARRTAELSSARPGVFMTIATFAEAGSGREEAGREEWAIPDSN
ncbi:antibiotic biosynthesis monooxygenase family protein [Microbacterium sp. TNHR37B]|uniref:antibiotic biosynthesis monooxygenase family protein n=1 Tax=Microbacterium sp. TNHR37B TaxID=1775956 RepID=UPI0009EF6281|nr:antibiotic biosynthesis monooxygenase [Microbacterium sp. TNHR37B]